MEIEFFPGERDLWLLFLDKERNYFILRSPLHHGKLLQCKSQAEGLKGQT